MSAFVAFVGVKDAIAERGRDRRRPIVPDRAEHLAGRAVIEAAQIRQEVDEPFIVDGVVGGEASDWIDPILGQTEIGLEANDRKRQVQSGVYIEIASAEGAIELEIRRSNGDPYPSESGEDAFRQLQGGVVPESALVGFSKLVPAPMRARMRSRPAMNVSLRATKAVINPPWKCSRSLRKLM